MPATTEQTDIQPVIFASNRLARLWPSSTEAVSYAFVPDSTGRSPFEQLMTLLAARPGFREPLVFATPSSAGEALRQCRNSFPAPPLVIAVDEDTPVGCLSILAAILTARRNRRSRCIFLPATLAGPQEALASAIGSLAAGDPSRPDAAGFLVRPAGLSAQLVFDLYATPSRAGWHPVRAVWRRAPVDDMADVPPHHVTIVGPSSMRAQDLLDMVHGEAPVVLQACHNALSTALTGAGGTMRPGQGFLSLAGRFDLAELIARHANRIMALPAPAGISVVTDWSDPNACEPAITPEASSLAQVIGIPAGRVVHGPGGILFLGEGRAAEVGFPRTRPTGKQRPATAAVHVHAHDRIASHDVSDIWRIIAAPGQTIGPECHFRRMEVWSVASGTGFAVIDGRRHDLQPGAALCIPVAACHQVTNTGPAPLVIYEMRTGLLRDDDDTLHLARLGAVS